jgi:hypothetical protein
MKKLGLLVGAMAVVLIGLVVVYTTVYNKPHTDFESQEASLEFTADALMDVFRADAAAATQELNNKVIAVSGSITAMEDNTFILNETVVCRFGDQPGGHLEDYAPGTEVKLKGRFVSFDDMLEEVRLDFCVLVY